MGDVIPAIETRYGGARFRSRLEARWAVFFDHMGIVWEYEPEGYETPDGRYLPDFRIYLRKLDKPTALFEVKPQYQAIQSDMCVCPSPLDPRWAHAAAMDAAPSLLVACGIPAGDRILEWVAATGGLHRIAPNEPNTHSYPHMFSTCPCCDRVVLLGGRSPNYTPPSAIRAAFDAACSARFEHGESG